MADKKKETKSRFIGANILYAYKGVWRYKKSLLFICLAASLSIVVSTYIWSFVGKFIIDDVQAGAPIEKMLFTVAVAGILTFICESLLNIADQYGIVAGAYVMFQYRRRYNRKFMKMDYEKLEDTAMLDKAEKALKGCNWGGGIIELTRYPTFALANIITTIVAAVIIATLNPWLLILYTGTGVIKAVSQVRTKTRDKRLCWDNMAPLNRKIRYLGQVQGDFSYAKDVRLFNMRHFLKGKHEGVNGEAHKLFLGHKNRWLGWEMKMYVMSLLEFAVQYGYLIWAFCFSDLTLGNFTLYTSAVTTYSDRIRYLFDNFAEMKWRSMEVDDYRSFVDEESLSDKDKGAFKHVPKSDRYVIEFKNVSFKYKGADSYALKNVNIRLETGKSLAVVGLNGAGKTTFIKLLCRLYDPDEGEILLNGTNIKDFNKDEYFDILSPVFQNVELFALTLGENVAMRERNAVRDNDALSALCDAGLQKKLDRLPKKLDTQVLKNIYDDGVDFSGGEKQKLALSRALYKGAPIILLDEPTAALDPIAEYELYKSFNKIVGGKMAVYISHRLSSTRFCDSIAMFAHGEIIERGTHDELINANGEYKKLFDVQAQYYREREQRTADGMEEISGTEVYA